MRGLLECSGNLFVPIDSICCHPGVIQVDKIEESGVDWQAVVNAIPCFLWGVLIVVAILVAMYIIQKYYCLPNMQNKHTREIKKDAFIQEMLWAKFEEIKACTDDELKKKAGQLDDEKSKLKEELSLEQKKVELLDALIKRYEKIWENNNLEIKPKDNK